MMPDRDDVIARLERMLGHADDPNVQDAFSDALTLLRETWRPMGELPRDGAWVLVLWSAPSGPPVEVAQWAQREHGPSKGRVCVPSHETEYPASWFDGWLPLPPLPKEEG